MVAREPEVKLNRIAQEHSPAVLLFAMGLMGGERWGGQGAPSKAYETGKTVLGGGKPPGRRRETVSGK
jgi:hypothetical protein